MKTGRDRIKDTAQRRRERVAQLRDEERLPFTAIGEAMNISQQRASQLYQRHCQLQNIPVPSRHYRR